MKIFAVYVGGRTPTSNIEVHDVRFVIAETVEDTYASLISQWWGVKESLHIDSWYEVTHADGYAITLKPEPSTITDRKLFFVNLGGYDGVHFEEAHKNVFVVAENEQKAKVKALKMVRDWQSFHRDYMFDVENAVCLNSVVLHYPLYVHLAAIDDQSQPSFTSTYRMIGKEHADA